MNLSSTSSAAEKAPRAMLWGCELNQEKRTWTVKAQKEGKQDCKLLLSTVALMGLELSPPVTFQLRAGSGPVFLSGQECYNTADLSWDEEEEELEEEEGDSDEVDDQDEDEDDVDVSLEEETPVKQVKRLASQKQASIAKKKKVEKEEEAVRPSLKDKSPVKKAKPTLKPKKPGSKK
ncbi:nucleoplasmin-2 isoform X2 [Ursus arctos]|uniref:nucleoplasmin-2 isoform X2 n=1 Tax=Ursus arctos TaxID=9644 RepID=UPI0025475C92|nr:nucleoplasmin-2 isoform X2 [Ursus arctos]